MELKIGAEISTKDETDFFQNHPTSYDDISWLWTFERNPNNLIMKTINKNKILDLMIYGNSIFEFGFKPKTIVLSGFFENDDTHRKEWYYDHLAAASCGINRQPYGLEATGEKKLYMDEFESADNGTGGVGGAAYKKRFIWVFGGALTETKIGERDSNVIDWQLEMIAIDPFKYSDELVGNNNTYTGTDDHGTANHLIDDQATFTDSLDGFLVTNTTDSTYARVTDWNSSTDLDISSDIMDSGESYRINLGVVIPDDTENIWSSLNGAVVYNYGSAFTEPIWKITNTGATPITKVEIGDTTLANCDNIRYNRIEYTGSIPQNKALYLKPRTTKEFNYYLLMVGWNTNTDTAYTTKGVRGVMPRMYPAETLNDKTIKLTGCTSAIVNCYYRHAFI